MYVFSTEASRFDQMTWVKFGT